MPCVEMLISQLKCVCALTQQGQNWMIGGNFQTSIRGIESDNLENHFINSSWCVTDINPTRVPFRY